MTQTTLSFCVKGGSSIFTISRGFGFSGTSRYIARKDYCSTKVLMMMLDMVKPPGGLESQTINVTRCSQFKDKGLILPHPNENFLKKSNNEGLLSSDEFDINNV